MDNIKPASEMLAIAEEAASSDNALMHAMELIANEAKQGRVECVIYYGLSLGHLLTLMKNGYNIGYHTDTTTGNKLTRISWK